ncbi:MAG TPA: hypothetical protein V6C57_08400 [Coleofasciculaceae cyanobacterium]
MLHSSPTWMMPHPKDVQPDFLPNSADDLLDASSLDTVLDMLAVIDSAEELALLEVLTPAQKRQVWDATPDRLKVRLKQIRSAHPAEKLTSPNAPTKPSAPETSAPETSAPETLDRSELTAPAVAELPDELEADREASEDELSELPDAFPDALPAVMESGLNPLPQVGDRVVLLAKSQLTAAEMKAVWQVMEVQTEYARIETQALGSRRYPLTWMIVYPG